MRKRIHKEELLFDVKDRGGIKLGKNLHIPNIGYINNNNEKIDWSIESLLVAREVAEDQGFEMIMIPDTVMTWSFTFYCRINGQTYHVTETRKKKYGDIDYKITLI